MLEVLLAMGAVVLAVWTVIAVVSLAFFISEWKKGRL